MSNISRIVDESESSYFGSRYLWGLKVAYYVVALLLNFLTIGLAPRKLGTKPSFKVFIQHMCVIHTCFILSHLCMVDIDWERQYGISGSVQRSLYTPTIIVLYYLLTFQITWLSLDRWAAVYFKLRYHKITTLKVSILAVFFMWLLAISTTSGTLTSDLQSYRLLIISSIILGCVLITIVSTWKLVSVIRGRQLSIVPADEVELRNWRHRKMKEDFIPKPPTISHFSSFGDDLKNSVAKRRSAIHPIVTSPSLYGLGESSNSISFKGQTNSISIPSTKQLLKDNIVIGSPKSSYCPSSSSTTPDKSIIIADNDYNSATKIVSGQRRKSDSSSHNIISLVRDGNTNTFTREDSEINPIVPTSEPICTSNKIITVSEISPGENETNRQDKEVVTPPKINPSSTTNSQSFTSHNHGIKSPSSNIMTLVESSIVGENIYNQTDADMNQQDVEKCSNHVEAKTTVLEQSTKQTGDKALPVEPRIERVDSLTLIPISKTQGTQNILPISDCVVNLSPDTKQSSETPEKSNSNSNQEQSLSALNILPRNSDVSVRQQSSKKIYFAVFLIATWHCITALPVGLYFMSLCLFYNSNVKIRPGDVQTGGDHLALTLCPLVSAIVNPLIYCWRLVVKKEWLQQCREFCSRLFNCSSTN